MREKLGHAAMSLLSRAGVSATVENGTRSGSLPKDPTSDFDTPDFDNTTESTTVHVSYLREPVETTDSTGERSDGIVNIYVPSDITVTDGDSDTDTQATRITLDSSDKTFRIVDVFDYDASVRKAMGVEE